jgi:membrane associated rhomboid family serine protease
MSDHEYEQRVILGGRMTPVVQRLIIATAIVFVFQLITHNAHIGIFGLIPVKVWGEIALWQLATYIFFHGGFFHLFFNMFALWMFGSELERLWGSKKFLFYYMLTGVGAGFTVCAFTPKAVIPTIGASGAIFGILLAYGTLFPNRIIYLYFLIPIKAKHFVIIFGVLELLAVWRYSADGISHFAHLGGIAFGLIYIHRKWLWRLLARFLFIFYWWRVKRKFDLVEDEEPPNVNPKDNKTVH